MIDLSLPESPGNPNRRLQLFFILKKINELSLSLYANLGHFRASIVEITPDGLVESPHDGHMALLPSYTVSKVCAERPGNRSDNAFHQLYWLERDMTLYPKRKAQSESIV